MVWQFNTIFKSPTAFRSLYHESSSCPSASQALPISARQTRYCRVEPARPEELTWLIRWRLAGFASVCLSFLRASQGKLCTTYADRAVPAVLLEHSAARNTLPCTALLRAFLGFLRTQLSISTLLAVHLQPQGKTANPQILSSKTVSWMFSGISILNIAKHPS